MEAHIRTSALRRALDPDDAYRLVLFEEEEELWAVGAHQVDQLVLASGEVIYAGRLVVLGLTLGKQGAHTTQGERYSDIAIDGLVRDVLEQHGHRVLTGLVVHENVRSQRLCRRHGLTSETLFDARYLRMTGNFEVPKGGRRT